MWVVESSDPSSSSWKIFRPLNLIGVDMHHGMFIQDPWGGGLRSVKNFQSSWFQTVWY